MFSTVCHHCYIGSKMKQSDAGVETNEGADYLMVNKIRL